jgi:hypothetical protein
MPSVREIKCPSCGAENGPCIVENGIDKYHVERRRAAYPTEYEHPDCAECKELKDAMAYTRDSLQSFQPDFGAHRSKSRWPRASKDELYRREKAANLARAKYEVHLGTDHNDEAHRNDLGQNVTVILREGRSKA